MDWYGFRVLRYLEFPDAFHDSKWDILLQRGSSQIIMKIRRESAAKYQPRLALNYDVIQMSLLHAPNKWTHALRIAPSLQTTTTSLLSGLVAANVFNAVVLAAAIIDTVLGVTTTLPWVPYPSPLRHRAAAAFKTLGTFRWDGRTRGERV